MTADSQMDADKGDVEMRDSDNDSKLFMDHLEESVVSDVICVKLESKEQEPAERQAVGDPVPEPAERQAEGDPVPEPVQEEPSKDCVELPAKDIAEDNVDGQVTNSEDKPDIPADPKVPDIQSSNPDVKEDLSNAQGTQEYSSIKSEITTATEQISSDSGNDGGNIVKSEMDNQEKLLFQLPVSEVPPKRKTDENFLSEKEEAVKKLLDKPHQSKDQVLMTEPIGTEKITSLQIDASEDNVKLAEKTVVEVPKPSPGNTPVGNKRQPATPDHAVQSSTTSGSGGDNGRVRRSAFSEVRMTDFDDGTPEEQAAFVKELEVFYRERDVEFKPPKFYGQLLNLLKLWRAVIKLGGYDLVTGTKSWRNVGESFHPPKTCTTVSWTFRIFYEKSLLEYERFLRQTGELQLPEAPFSELASVDNEGNGHQASGSGRARRDAAARAMQGWHVQRLFGHNEEKNVTSMPKRENKVKSIGSIKQKRPDEVELPVKSQRTETSKQLTTSVVDVGPPADWVKINVRETKDCFEVYALVPGLLREEVRVQSDPAGRLVITGQPEQQDNPWGITAFKKVVTLPARIDPLQTSAVVSLHGRLFVRVPFEQSHI